MVRKVSVNQNVDKDKIFPNKSNDFKERVLVSDENQEIARV